MSDSSEQTPPRFLMIGGFLGAGKTTTIGRLAKHYQDQGKQVVIVTNDQATDLVDTLLLRSQGFDVGEVAGSCFCCNFNELTNTVEKLGSDQRPDIVLAEPVGSCTDLVATVIRPLEQIYQQKFDIAPFGVIIKPSHGFKILDTNARVGFSPQAEYIFRKQLEEADFVILNRVDELSDEEITRLTSLLQSEFPGTPIVKTSAKTGNGFDTLCDVLDQQGVFGQRTIEVDYDVYAEGEAELGWLNCQVEIEAQQSFELDPLLLTLAETLRTEMSKRDAEIAHLKVIGLGDGVQAVVNVISNINEPTLSLASNSSGMKANLVVNARVAIAPEDLSDIVTAAVKSVTSTFASRTEVLAMQSFRPGRPVPTHRL